VIGQYDPVIYPGVSVGGVGAGQTVQKYLQVIQKSDGKKVPAKYDVVKGSELLIIEPEYIVWDGTQELYPFIFESIGNWGVTTSVTPPEGFAADYPNLSTTVNTEMKSLQFTITDIGSSWAPTGGTYALKHKAKTKYVKSKIGVKCSKRLAHEKGFNELCKKLQ
jgi:hypothetical protein